MKKISFLIFAITILFFSCATSKEVAKNDFPSEDSPQIVESENPDSQNFEDENSDSQILESEIENVRIEGISENENSDSQLSENEIENPQIEEIAENDVSETEVLAEKIPQEELDELERLLAQGEIPPPELVLPDEIIEEILETPEMAEETQIAEAEIPAQTEDDLRIEEPLAFDDEILATDFPANDEEFFQEEISQSPPAQNDLPVENNFQGGENSDSNEANPESEISEISENEDDVVEVAENESVVPSRTMSLKRNQFVDIIYPGSGWIYLGEVDGAEHFSFYGRAIDDDECVFTLRSKKSGNAILHFYKNDALTGNYIDDYIAIEIDDENALDASHVKAPSYALAVPKRFDRESNALENNARDFSDSEAKTEVASIDAGAVSQDSGGAKISQNNDSSKKLEESAPLPAKIENRPAERVQTAIQDSRIESQDDASVTSIASAENPSGVKKDAANSSSRQTDGDSAQDILRRAQKAYDEKRHADALALLKSFFEAATADFDAGLYLQGLVLEAQSEVRDIKSAIDSYDTVVNNFPQSKFWTRANERGIYLKRFYIDIR